MSVLGLGRNSLLLFLAFVGMSSVVRAGELPPEFHGRWELSSTYAAFWGSCWEVPAERSMQVYMAGDVAFFWGSDLWGGDSEATYQFTLDAQPMEGRPAGYWTVNFTSPSEDPPHLVFGCSPPIMMFLQAETIVEGDCTVCRNPPCLVMDSRNCEDEPVGFYSRAGTTAAETIPLSALKARY
jgi:hypothetical protein